MKLREFCKSRNLKPGTVSAYLNRYPEMRKKCTKDGKDLVLTQEVLNFLEKKYPLPEPVHVIQGIDPKEYERVQILLASTQAMLEKAQERVSLYEEKLERANLAIEQKDAEIGSYRKSIFGLYKKTTS